MCIYMKPLIKLMHACTNVARAYAYPERHYFAFRIMLYIVYRISRWKYQKAWKQASECGAGEGAIIYTVDYLAIPALCSTATSTYRPFQ